MTLLGVYATANIAATCHTSSEGTHRIDSSLRAGRAAETIMRMIFNESHVLPSYIQHNAYPVLDSINSG